MTDFRALTADEARAAGLDPDFALRVLGVESGGRDGLTSSAGAYGPMQLMPATARDMGVDPRDPRQNIRGGVRYLKQQMDTFGDPRLAAAAYNAGPGAVKKYGGVPPYRETQAYVDKVAPQTSDDIFGFAPAGGAGPSVAGASDDIFGFDKPQANTRPPPPPVKASPPKVLVGSDVAKGATAGAIRGAAGSVDTIAQGPGTMPWFINLAANAASAIGAPNASAALRGTADAMSGAATRGAVQAIPVAGYQPQTLPGKIAEKAGEYAPSALMGPAGAPKTIAGQVIGRAANVALPAVGAVAGREGVRALGGGDTAQAVGEFVGGIGGGLVTGLKAPKMGQGVAAPTLEQLQAQKNTAYQAVEQSGIKYSPKAVDALVDWIYSELRVNSMNPKLHPKAQAMMEYLDTLRGKPMTLNELDQLRQVVRRDVAKSSEEGDAFMGKRMISTIDQFAEQVGGSPTLNAARAANTRYRKVEAVQDAQDSAVLRAGSTGSGGNVDNATRQNMRRVLENTPNLTPDEEAQLRKVVLGTPVQNTMRLVGKLSPNGGALGAAVNATAAGATHMLSVPLSFGLMGVKAIADNTTQRNVAKLIDLMASGGQKGAAAQQQLKQLGRSNRSVQLAYNEAARKLLMGGLVASSSLAPVPLAAQEAPTGQ